LNAAAVLVQRLSDGWMGYGKDQPLTSPRKHMPVSAMNCATPGKSGKSGHGTWCQGRSCQDRLVVGTEGGLLTRMLTPFEFGLGGPIGSGQQ